MIDQHAQYILAFDTANEMVSVALGLLDPETRTVECVTSTRLEAHRSSNTKLLPTINALLATAGIERGDIAAVACGRGPGSFTGVRICMATAKGVASALEVGLIGVSTLDALAWELQMAGARGRVLVVADAMRREVYPVHYELTDEEIQRQGTDTVVSATAMGSDPGVPFNLVAGDALAKYATIFDAWGPLADRDAWTVKGPGLLACVQQMWRANECDPFDVVRHNPAFVLPVYTRLSDAEENERARLAKTTKCDLRTGVDGAPGSDPTVSLRPLAAADVDQVAWLESQLMAGDAWNARLVLDDLGRKDRSWWGAFDTNDTLIGYVGGQIVAGQLQLLKVAVAEQIQRQGVARALLAQLADDARNLAATEITLEVRAGNKSARAFYEALGLEFVGNRPGYYSDEEDAAIYTGPLPVNVKDVAGMELDVSNVSGDVVSVDGGLTHDVAQDAALSTPCVKSPSLDANTPLILAIESSCDETAAAVIDGAERILADVVASQVDFHARFGGVVPEIASRKHIEAIYGVTQVCLEQAATNLGRQALRYRDLDAIAVTYAPGLVGALVVGVAFAKGAAWAADIPLVQVNHLEGHLYANKFATPDLAPPMVASLVSGGHTLLVHVRAWGDYEILGSTIDDAVGEAFDKVAKALGLGYPGGPVISRLAVQGNPKAIDFPRAMLHSGDLHFSLSGLKTAVATYIQQQQEAGNELNLPDIAASFQAAVVDVQVAKACTALDETGAKEFCLGGGVAANPALQKAYEQACKQRGVRLTVPPASACTDNAAMIALVALDRYAQARFASLDADAFAHTNLEEPY